MRELDGGGDAELGDVVAERAVRPRAAAAHERREDGSIRVAGEKRELESHAPALVTRVAVLSVLGDVRPAVRCKQASNPVVICGPDGQIEVVVRPAHPAGVEVDRPAPEQPGVDPVCGQKPLDGVKCCELRFLAHARAGV